MVAYNRAWTEEEIQKAIELFDKSYSCAKIASIMNEEGWRNDCPKITRNSIVGLLHRNGLHRDKTVKIVTIKQIAVEPVKETALEIVEEDETKGNEKETLRSSIVDLLAWECRYPIGNMEDKDFHFCAEQIDQNRGRSYCSKHYDLCYYPARRQLRA